MSTSPGIESFPPIQLPHCWCGWVCLSRMSPLVLLVLSSGCSHGVIWPDGPLPLCRLTDLCPWWGQSLWSHQQSWWSTSAVVRERESRGMDSSHRPAERPNQRLWHNLHSLPDRAVSTGVKSFRPLARHKPVCSGLPLQSRTLEPVLMPPPADRGT